MVSVDAESVPSPPQGRRQQPPVPSPRRWPHPGSLFSAALGVYALDQLTKWWALEALAGGRTIEIVGSLRLRLVFNTGAAFSLGSGLGPLLGLLVVGVIVALVLAGRTAPDRRTAVTVGVVAGGAIGNLSDRLLRDGGGFLGGAVVDFIDLGWWPVFNVADMAVVVGGVILAVLLGRTAPTPPGPA